MMEVFGPPKVNSNGTSANIGAPTHHHSELSNLGMANGPYFPNSNATSNPTSQRFSLPAPNNTSNYPFSLPTFQAPMLAVSGVNIPGMHSQQPHVSNPMILQPDVGYASTSNIASAGHLLVNNTLHQLSNFSATENHGE